MGNIGEWLGLIIVVAILFNNGSGIFGGGNDTQAQINAALANQSTSAGLRDILLSSANNNYETAMLISNQTRDYMQSNYTNQINVVQGFNAIQSALAGISNQIGSCCCDIKTTLLQSRYDDALRENARLLADKSNADQSAYLLSVMGKWIANPAAV